MASLAEALRLRWLRRRLLWRAIRSRHRLTRVIQRPFARDAILCFGCLRNEAARLPWFLDHHRRLGVDHFLFVDNASTDGSPDYLAAQPDVSLWTTPDSYKASRFGLDWINWLMMRHGSGHWCLTLDADELFSFPQEARGLRALTTWLETQGADHMAALMLDLYPRGALGTQPHMQGQNPLDILEYFDPDGYSFTPTQRYAHVSIRGGPRARVFFDGDPSRGPHLHKTPLVRWHWRHAWLSSTHLALPQRLNDGFQQRDLPVGVLLHTKFLPEILSKSAEEKTRAEHFTHPEHYGAYYDAIVAGPVLWHAGSQKYESPEQLENLGLIWRGRWGS